MEDLCDGGPDVGGNDGGDGLQLSASSSSSHFPPDLPPSSPEWSPAPAPSAQKPSSPSTPSREDVRQRRVLRFEHLSRPADLPTSPSSRLSASPASHLSPSSAPKVTETATRVHLCALPTAPSKTPDKRYKRDRGSHSSPLIRSSKRHKAVDDAHNTAAGTNAQRLLSAKRSEEIRPTWEDEVLMYILMITVTTTNTAPALSLSDEAVSMVPRFLTDRWGPRELLEGLSQDLSNLEGMAPAKMGLRLLDSALIERLNLPFSSSTSHISYLMSCFWRCEEARKATTRSTVRALSHVSCAHGLPKKTRVC